MCCRSESLGSRAHEAVIDADAEQIPVGIDGESVLMPTPVHRQIRPGALRVRVPRERLGSPKPTPTKNLDLLRKLALSTGPSSRDGRDQRTPT